MNQALADATLLAHLAFIAWVMFGALLTRARGEPDGIVSFDRAGLAQLPALARRRRSSVWSLAAAATLAATALTSAPRR